MRDLTLSYSLAARSITDLKDLYELCATTPSNPNSTKDASLQLTEITEVLDNFETFAGLYLGARIEMSGQGLDRNALRDPSFTPSHSNFESVEKSHRLTSFQN